MGLAGDDINTRPALSRQGRIVTPLVNAIPTLSRSHLSQEMMRQYLRSPPFASICGLPGVPIASVMFYPFFGNLLRQ